MSIDHQSPMASRGRATGHFALLWLVRLTMESLPSFRVPVREGYHGFKMEAGGVPGKALMQPERS
jgi:hypothetical protein